MAKQSTNDKNYTPCPYTLPCYMRNGKGECTALTEVDFADGKCHFRKTRRYGANLYDARRAAR